MSPSRIPALLLNGFLAFTVAACAATPSPERPASQHGRIVTCQVVGDCYAQVEALCPNGFVLNGGVSRNMVASCKQEAPADSYISQTASLTAAQRAQ
jgi:hypothetical protein